MKVSRWKVVALPVALFGVASPMLTNCDALKGIANDPSKLGELAEGCPEYDKADFSGMADLDPKMRGLLEASAKFDKLAVEMEMGVIEACGELGKALGMKDEELKAEAGGGEGAKKACEAVAGKVDAFFKANADVKLGIELSPPKCYVPIDATVECLKGCGSPVSPGEFKASCQGGELSGECSGKCEGSCSVEAGAECTGTCSGSCSGKCDVKFSGKCGGKCNGKCDGKDSKGAKCAGTCEGSCDAQAEGSCGGKCEGKCDAKCEAKVTGGCKGQCTGGCDVDFKAPSCTGEFKPPKVSIECQTQCAAKAAAALKCDPPSIAITLNGKSSAEVTALIGGLRKALPKIVAIGEGKGKALAKAGVELGTQVKGAVDAIGKASAKAALCAGIAAKGVASAAAGVTLSVDVSVKVSASASGSAKAGG